MLLFVAAISVGFLINASIGTGGKQEADAGISGQGQGDGSETGADFVGPGQPTKSVDLGDIGNGDLVFQKGSGEIWSINARDSEPVRLTQEQKSYTGASVSPDGEKIAFATGGTEGGPARIYVTNIDGSDQARLVEDSGTPSSPAWSPDGERIAFALTEPGDKRCTIYAMSADGSDDPSALITMERCYSIDSLSWSPDGEKMAFEGAIAADPVDIWVLEVAGGQGGTNKLSKLTQASRSWSNVDPAWSPDGTEIAFTHKETQGFGQYIYKIDADGSGETRLTHELPFRGDPDEPPVDPTYFPANSPVFSPDGEKIAFVRGYRFLENPDPDLYTDTFPLSSAIYVMDSDGSNPTVVGDFSLEQVANLDWLPGQGAALSQGESVTSGEPATDDCKTVGEMAFAAGEDIWTMNADGSDPTRLTNNESREESPVFSPDGRKIAFVKEVAVEGGSQYGAPGGLVAKVVVMDLDTCDQTVLPVPEGKYAAEPSWSSDGERIAFWYPAEDGGMFVVNADGSGTARRIYIPDFPGFKARPEWAPNGDRIAFQMTSSDGWAGIYIVNVSPDGTTGRPRQLPHEGLLEAAEPSWSPDGTEIAFSGIHSGYHAPGKGYHAIFKIDLNTLEQTRLTKGFDTEYLPSWSSDGEKIAYVRDTSSKSSIYVVGSDGSGQTLVRSLPFGRLAPDWRASP